MTRQTRQWLYRFATLIAVIATLSFLFGRSKNSLLPIWVEVKRNLSNIPNVPKCHINYNPAETYDQLSPAWNLRPDFAWNADNCFINLRRQQLPSDDASYLIPRIIHQIWESDNVPESYIEWSRSWQKVNPGWQHWFWTYADGRELVSRYRPAQLELWGRSPFFRASVMKYYVIRRYGGVYVDLDYQALRPLDLWAKRYRCIFSEEPYEHAFPLNNRSGTFVSSAFFACSPGHPAMTKAIDHLTDAAQKLKFDVMRAMGPYLLDSALKIYSENLRRNHQSQTTLQQCVDASVTVLPPYYFQPVYSQQRDAELREICGGQTAIASRESDVVCTELRRNNYANQVNPIAYAVHWWHAAWNQLIWKQGQHVSFVESVRNIKVAGQWALTGENNGTSGVNWCM